LRLPLTLLKGVYATSFGAETPAPTLRAEPALTPTELADAIAPAAPIVISGGVRGTKGNALDRAKKGHALYALPAVLPPGAVRDSSTVPAGHWLPVDLDGIAEEAWAQTLRSLEHSGAWFLAFNTFSDGLKDVHLGRRIRVVLLLDRPAKKSEFAQAYRRVAHLLGARDDVPLRADEAAGKPEQLAGVWCVPSQEVVAAAGVAPSPWQPLRVVRDGFALSVDRLLASSDAATDRTQPHGTQMLGMGDALQPTGRLAVLASNSDLIHGVPGHEPLPVTIERVKAALRWLSAECSRSQWIEVGVVSSNPILFRRP
jgi:hypothetical protein